MPLSPQIHMRRWAGGLALLMVAAASGCGSSVGKISGKVYYKNVPLKGGNVSFVSADKTSQIAKINEDGSYTVEKVSLGETTICVETASLKPPPVGMPKSKGPPGGETPGGYQPPDYAARAKRYTPIPERYASPEKSKLTYMVVGGSQEHDIKLE
jgi:hypothetical protein